ncbi:MAG: hypothetical protein AMJ79_12010 [Phycisphaerae bacterium SM23_30]|nr:MAG: hypothetical protein AMJ79_12010 [Phycisphaerae bacterium SM23_30]
MKSPRNYHIFVVDDEPQVCKAVGQILRQKYKVTCFENAAACFTRLSESGCRCDLLISDIKMPGMSGMELLRKVRRVRPLLTVLLITGYGDIPLAVQAIKAGARDFIEKPLHEDKLLQATESTLQERSFSDTIAGKPLTKREKKILKLIVSGQNNRQIAQALQRSIRTIEDRRRVIMRKLNVHNVVDLVKVAQKIDLTDSD